MNRRPTVVLVDDDDAVIASTASALRDDYEVRSFTSATAALEALAGFVPDVIVSDIVMPRVGGFELRRLYAARFEGRRTPFLFLSSLSDADTIVAALDAGADDFLTKPIVPELLRARLRATLRRAAPPRQAVFRGDLSRMPFVSLLQFCEAKAFTGDLAIEAGDLRVRLALRAGELDLEAADPWLDRLCALGEGHYVLRPASPDFAELERAEAEAAAESGASARVSTLRVRDKVLHLETQLVPGEAPAIVTMVLAGATPIAKVRRRVPPDASSRELQGLIDAQHEEVRASTLDRISAVRQKQDEPVLASTGASEAPPTTRSADTPAAVATPARAATKAQARVAVASTSRDPAPLSLTEPEASPHASRAAALVEDGFDLYREGDYLGALARWEAAQQLDPESRTLAVNIAVARRKLDPAT